VKNTVHPYASSHASSTALMCAAEDTEDVLSWKRGRGVSFDKGSVPTGAQPMYILMSCM